MEQRLFNTLLVQLPLHLPSLPENPAPNQAARPPARSGGGTSIVGGPDADRTSDKRHDEGKDAWWMDGDEEVEGASPLIRIDHR